MFSWQTPEYYYVKKSANWYWALGIISASMAIAFVLLGNVLFSIIIVLAAVVLGFFAAKEPKNIKVVITEKGMAIDNTYFPYSSLESFWIDEDPRDEKILIKSKKLFMPLISIPVREHDIQKIGDLLADHILEEELEEPLSQKIMEYLGF